MKWLNRLARNLYDLLCRFGHVIRPAVRRDLESLHPGESAEEMCRGYYIKKIEKSLLIFAAGCVMAVLLAVRAAGERKLEQGNIIRRGDILSDSQRVTVEADHEGQKDSFEFLVEPRQLSPGEMQDLYQQFCEEIEDLIAGDNKTLNEVRSDLELREQYEGYPFLVEWRSSDTEWVASDGAVHQGEEEREVWLTASVSYGLQEWELRIPALVAPGVLTPQERLYRDLEKQLIDAEQMTREEEYLVLPESIHGSSIQWQRKAEDYSFWLGAGALAVSVLIFLLSDKDLHTELEQQRKCMKREYPDIVHKLALYIGAGMTMQGAFQKVAGDYERGRSAERARDSPICEQMLFTCRELKSGVSEGAAYERFGKRTGIQEYIRLSTLMTQNLKKGSGSLLSRLREEADKALAERIQAGKKLGEEASTKLLLPMIMMLGVVMVMVILPAFSSMGL